MVATRMGMLGSSVPTSSPHAAPGSAVAARGPNPPPGSPRPAQEGGNMPTTPPPRPTAHDSIPDTASDPSDLGEAPSIQLPPVFHPASSQLLTSPLIDIEQLMQARAAFTVVNGLKWANQPVPPNHSATLLRLMCLSLHHEASLLHPEASLLHPEASLLFLGPFSSHGQKPWKKGLTEGCPPAVGRAQMRQVRGHRFYA